MDTVKKLSGKVAIVTASTDGIGYAIAERLGLDGAQVSVSSREQKNVDAAVKAMRAKNIDVIGTVCDVGKAEEIANMIRQTVNKFGGIDILVSNAAFIPTPSKILKTPEGAWEKVFEVNVKASFLLCREIVPYMQKRGGGSIVLVSSAAAYQSPPMHGVYSVSKTAMLGLAKALVPELSKMNIRVNCLAPGVIQTQLSEPALKIEGVVKKLKRIIPLGRIGQPHDCSGIVSFLASDDSSYVTGDTMIVDGGLINRL